MNDLCVAAVVMRSGFGEIESNLEKMERFVRMAARQGSQIICFPEMSITGYALKQEIREFAEPVPGPSTARVQRMARESDIIIIAGLAERTGHGGIAVTQIIASPDDRLEMYRKIHLSEGEQALFQSGGESPVFTTGETTFGIQLCYDAHFPELSTIMALRGAEVLFMPHASPPPESADEKRERWMRYLSARAYDNSVYVVACNQTGDGGSGIRFSGVALVIDPRGEIIAETLGDEEKMVISKLKAKDLERTRSTRMGFFLARRRPDLYGVLTTPMADTAFGRPGRRIGSCEEKMRESARGAQASSNS